jgi:type II secretory pathway pseudopilin PulG
MIEILIAISIIVTFSSLTGAVFARKYEESKESYSKLDLGKIQDGLTMYFTKNGKYPLELEQLVTLVVSC